jgi:AAA+ ATPase superfamily predicted ATPase
VGVFAGAGWSAAHGELSISEIERYVCFIVIPPKNKSEAEPPVPLLIIIIEQYSAKELDIFHAEMLLPFPANQAKLR